MEISGADALLSRLKEMATYDDVKTAVKVNGGELANSAIRNAEFKGHYVRGVFVRPTGATKRSIVPKLSSDGLSVVVAPTTEYAPFLELGTRFMTAQPFLAPAMMVQRVKYLNDLKRLMN